MKKHCVLAMANQKLEAKFTLKSEFIDLDRIPVKYTTLQEFVF
jgi:hypothetical protein